ncbi:MAG: farnesyl-diphosphate synthase [Cyanobacteria bacterium QS_9_48_30]|nr:MAG: farnesyl-diphosphate synthase [Cyanobacteria bacterium QS_9_48_30]
MIDGQPSPKQDSPAFDLETYLEQRKALVEEALERSLLVTEPERIYEAMRYSLLAGGKRLRPILCLATCELAGGTVEMAMPAACALEMIHTMSLIHDDLPAMDNDDYRRGKLTNHKLYGEDMAILAGDGLLAYAFESVATQTQNVPASQVLEVVAQMGRAVGAAGLVGGQVMDLEAEGNSETPLETLNYIHTHKTGTLLETCVVSGAILAGAADQDLQRLSKYAQNLGLAFQIVDDILDITASQEELGKTAGKDVQAKKSTYPSILGLEESKTQAKQRIEAAVALVDIYGEKAEPLRAIAKLILTRKN